MPFQSINVRSTSCGLASVKSGAYEQTSVARARSFVMTSVRAPNEGYLAAGLFGFGIGGVLTLLPIAWADYFGRANFGAIRGLVLSTQVLAQATGPLASGALHDFTGNYVVSLQCFAAVAVLSVAAALAARPPGK